MDRFDLVIEDYQALLDVVENYQGLHARRTVNVKKKKKRTVNVVTHYLTINSTNYDYDYDTSGILFQYFNPI